MDRTESSLNIIHSEEPPASRSVPLLTPIVLGRQSGNGVTLCIEDRKLSRKHVTFKVDQNNFIVEDHGSLNGTYVNGDRIATPTVVTAGAIIRAGQTLFELGPASPRQASPAELAANAVPLRERKADIPALAAHFLEQASGAKKLTMSVEFVEALALYSWPGNVSELEAFLKRASVASGPVLGVNDLPTAVRNNGLKDTQDLGPPDGGGDVPSELELLALVEKYQGDMEQIAKRLGKSIQQVSRWMKKHRVTPDKFR